MNPESTHAPERRPESSETGPPGAAVPESLLFQSMGDAVVVKDARLVIVSVNDAYCRLIRRPAAEIVGHTDAELFDPAMAKFFNSSDREVIATMRPVVFERPQPAEGVTRVMHVMKSPILGPEGAFHGVLVVLRDITDLKLLETESRQRGRALEHLANAATDFLDKDQWQEAVPGMLRHLGETLGIERIRIHEVQQIAGAGQVALLRFEWMSGERPGRIVALRGLRLETEGSMEWAEQLAQGRVIGAHTREMPPHVRRRYEEDGIKSMAAYPVFAGQRWWGSVQIASMDAEREFTPTQADTMRVMARLLGTLIRRSEELAQRRGLEDKLEQARRMESLGNLAGGIAHDFNNLFQGILGNAEYAAKGLEEGTQTWLCVEEISRATRRAADLAAQMLAYAGRAQVFARTACLARIIEESDALGELQRKFGAPLEVSVEPELPAVEVDAKQILHLVRNLVANAFEAMAGREGAVRLRLRAERAEAGFLNSQCRGAADLGTGDYVVLEVADDGAGMDAAILPDIFDPFFTTKFPGRGLGLAAALGIARAHRGAIHVSSARERGSVFRLYLPCAPRQVRRAPAGDSAGSRPVSILLVDDEELVRDYIKRLLQGERWRLEEAPSGEDALALFAGDPSRFDLAVVDLALPGMDGIRVIEGLRELRPDLPVVLISGYGEEQIRERGGAHSVQGYLKKPFRAKALFDTIEGACPR